MAAKAPALPLIGGGATRFQPVYVGDVAKAVARALKDPAAAGRTYELGGPTIYTFREILELVMRETGRRRALAPLPFFAAKLMGQAFDLVTPVLPFDPPLTAVRWSCSARTMSWDPPCRAWPSWASRRSRPRGSSAAICTGSVAAGSTAPITPEKSASKDAAPHHA
jgi:hypothetical protein